MELIKMNQDWGKNENKNKQKNLNQQKIVCEVIKKKHKQINSGQETFTIQ